MKNNNHILLDNIWDQRVQAKDPRAGYLGSEQELFRKRENRGPITMFFLRGMGEVQESE